MTEPSRKGVTDQLRQNAKTLRRDATQTDQRLWYALRAKQLGGLKFRRQHPIDSCVSDGELANCKAAWKAPEYKATRGTLYKYIKNVKSASEGCVTDE